MCQLYDNFPFFSKLISLRWKRMAWWKAFQKMFFFVCNKDKFVSEYCRDTEKAPKWK